MSCSIGLQGKDPKMSLIANSATFLVVGMPLVRTVCIMQCGALPVTVGGRAGRRFV